MLTDKQVKALKAKDKPYKVADYNGLRIVVRPTGVKVWQMKYKVDGKEKTLTIGRYPEISLKDARNERDDARAKLRNGIDPNESKKAKAKKESPAPETKLITFSEVGEELFRVRAMDWGREHKKRNRRIFDNDLAPPLGDRAFALIRTPDLLEVLRTIEAREAFETAKKARQLLGQIWRLGQVSGYCENVITHGLADAMKRPPVQHRAAITDPEQLGGLLRAIYSYNGGNAVPIALRLTPILFQRPGEMRSMEWSELDLAAKLWRIPDEKMKMGLDHIVPLPDQAIKLLREQKKISGGGKYVFPNPKSPSRPLSENGVRTALRTLGYDGTQVTPHGFRATARTLLDEVLGFPPHLIEHQLAHAVKDVNGRAYNRTTHLDKRRDMMQAWADYLDRLREGKKEGA